MWSIVLKVFVLWKTVYHLYTVCSLLYYWTKFLWIFLNFGDNCVNTFITYWLLTTAMVIFCYWLYTGAEWRHWPSRRQLLSSEDVHQDHSKTLSIGNIRTYQLTSNCIIIFLSHMSRTDILYNHRYIIIYCSVLLYCATLLKSVYFYIWFCDHYIMSCLYNYGRGEGVSCLL